MVKPSLIDGAKVAGSDDYEYLHNFVHPLPGWLFGYWTFWPGRGKMRSLGRCSKIGVYHGRCLALVLRSALRTKERVVALENFQFIPLETVKTGVAPIADSESAVWLQMPSTLCSSCQLLQILGADPRLISIDGSHECDDVFWDMRLAEDMLAPRGGG